MKVTKKEQGELRILLADAHANASLVLSGAKDPEALHEQLKKLTIKIEAAEVVDDAEA